jgi:hypothetical protein
MASKEDGAKVDAVEYEAAGIKVDVRLNKKVGTFSAEWGDKRWKNTDLVTLKEEVRQYLKDSTTAEWFPIIAAAATGGSRYSGKDDERTGLEIERFYVAMVAGALRRVDWSQAQHGNFDAQYMLRYSKSFHWKDNGREFTPPISDYEETKTYNYGYREDPHSYLPFTEETWKGLQLMQARIKEIRERTKLILSTTQGHNLIIGLAQQLQIAAITEE